MIILFLILILGIVAVLCYCLHQSIFKGRVHFFIYFFLLFLPFYATIQVLTFQFIGDVWLISGIKYIKELMLLLAVVFWLLYRRNLFSSPFGIHSLDYLYITFLAYAFVYVLAPIGPSSFLDKLLYFKNMLTLGVMYFLGRVLVLDKFQVKIVLNLILIITILAFTFNLAEKVFDTHFQSQIAYSRWNQEINDIQPAGIYDLTYTFGSASGAKRFAAFFANPLELAAAMLLSFSAALIAFMNSQVTLARLKSGVWVLLSVGCLLFAYSRSAIGAFFLMLFFIALILGYYRFLLYGFLLILTFLVSAFFFGGEGLWFLIIDTINFADPSSVGHVVEWLDGIDSIISNSFGIGLATSGNTASVVEEYKVGGENQFIIFGVQLGVPFLLLYIGLIYSSIKVAVKAFKTSGKGYKRTIPFIAATFKFAFILPLMTSNAELSLYVAYISWFMVGQSVTIFMINKQESLTE